jgi:hypothetical protein
MRQSWTDDRLDDFRAETQRRFEEVDRRFDEVDRRFDKVDRRFDKVDERFDKVQAEIKDLGREMNARFDSLQRVMLQFSGLLIVTLAGFIVTQL